MVATLDIKIKNLKVTVLLEINNDLSGLKYTSFIAPEPIASDESHSMAEPSRAVNLTILLSLIFVHHHYSPIVMISDNPVIEPFQKLLRQFPGF